MDGDGPSSSLTHPISRSQLTSKKTAGAATFRQRRQSGFTSKATRSSNRSKEYDVRKLVFEKLLKGDLVMTKHLLTIIGIVGVGLFAGTVFFPNTRTVAAESPESAVVFNADGTVNVPTGFRAWVFVGAPLTPNGLNNGKYNCDQPGGCTKSNFPEYHHVYIEKKNVDAYLKTGEFPEGTVIVKELTRV